MARSRNFVAFLRESAGGGLRFVNMAVSLRLADVEVLPDGTRRTGQEEELLRIGGRWDRSRKKWAGAALKLLVLRVHRGQESAARWLARWFRGHISGDWTGFRRVFSALFMGGRRSGKSYLSLAALVLFAIANPRANLWAVSRTMETSDELDQELRRMLPASWYERREAGANKTVTFKIANGSRIVLRSAHKVGNLKAGRVDFALLNEGQLHPRKAYTQLRGGAADRGGLVIVAANPPDEPIGRWVEEQYHATRSGEIDAEAFDFDPRLNPHIDYAALSSLEKEEDEKTFQREVLGIFAPIGDVVFHAWSDRESLRDPPAHFRDVTAEVTRRELGRAVGYVVGMDFQFTPHMAAVVHKFFVDPEDPDAEPLLWVVDEVVCEKADEFDLVDALEQRGRWTPGGVLEEGYRGWREPGDDPHHPVHCAVVMDASGFFQDGAHSRGATSDKALASRRWTELYKPQKESDRNPEIRERCKVANSRLKAASGRRRLFVAKRCPQVAEALRRWEIKNGQPFRKSVYAHLSDCVSYTTFRFFSRPKVKREVDAGYEGDKRFNRRSQMRGVFSGGAGDSGGSSRSPTGRK